MVLGGSQPTVLMGELVSYGTRAVIESLDAAAGLIVGAGEAFGGMLSTRGDTMILYRGDAIACLLL